MKAKLLFCVVISLLITSFATLSIAQGTVPANQAAIRIPGGTLAGGENAGLLEQTINGDTTAAGARINPNRIYQLNEGQVYFQQAAITVVNPTGVLAIVGVPSDFGKTKPLILMLPVVGTPVAINVVYGSIKCVNLHWQVQQTDKTINNELFFCGTKNKLPQSLVIDNCLFEFAGIDLFDCTDEAGAIGGWPNGAKIRITNSYFRNLFNTAQWWWSRVYQCKHPIDTLWVENNTITGGGLTFLQQNQLTDFAYFNHNTIVNNHKYWLLAPYYRELYITNNIFINQNWVGEDAENVANSGQDPDKLFQGTISIDTIKAPVITQSKYWLNGDSTKFTDAVSLGNLRVYVADNINFNDPLLTPYYSSNPQSYLTWFGGTPPFAIKNIPGMWMNSRTQALFAAYPHGMIEKRTSTADPLTVTRGIKDAAVATQMAAWNQNRWEDPAYPATANDITNSAYIFGDYDPQTIPGNNTEDGAGITKFTDLTEDFSQTANLLSAIDGLPIGSLIWNDTQNTAFVAASPATRLTAVKAKYVADGGSTAVETQSVGTPGTYTLSQNYPNPFNPSTTLKFSLPHTSDVSIVVYNTLGNKIRTLVDRKMQAGSYSVIWDGADNAGIKVFSGIYFCKMVTPEFTKIQKMTLLK